MITHLALIMDGNRRWATKRSMFPWLGHRQGAKTVEMAIQYCLDKKISYLSLYTLSLENLSRKEQEVLYLFGLIQEARDRAADFVKNGVKVRFVGDLSKLPLSTQQACAELEQTTSMGSALVCNFLLCYGGQQEIISAVERMVRDRVELVDRDVLKSYLWLGSIPDPELIIRTGGVQRISNFLLFQTAYAEIRFLDCLWPDLTAEILDQTIQSCLQAPKNFGI